MRFASAIAAIILLAVPDSAPAQWRGGGHFGGAYGGYRGWGGGYRGWGGGYRGWGGYRGYGGYGGYRGYYGWGRYGSGWGWGGYYPYWGWGWSAAALGLGLSLGWAYPAYYPSYCGAYGPYNCGYYGYGYSDGYYADGPPVYDDPSVPAAPAACGGWVWRSDLNQYVWVASPCS